MDALDADLVLEGGGVKGIALVGAISVLEERGYVFHRVAGTSAGSIVGSLVAAGYSSAELADLMAAVDYKKFRDGDLLDHLGIFGKGLSLLFEQGIYEGQYLKRWLGEQLETKGISTFADLKPSDPGSSLPPDKQYKLVVMTSDISYGRLRRLPWDYNVYGITANKEPVADAVRASMSIPFFYEPVKVKDSAGEDCWLVDGGMLSNFPVDTFDRTDGQRPRWPTFGIKLSARPEAKQGVTNEVHHTISMAKAMIETMTGFYDDMHVDDPAVQARTIFVDTMKVPATDFDLDEATQEALYKNGRDAALRFLDGGDGQPPWNWDDYLAKYRSTVVNR
jgi:NTE family protein